MFNFLIDKKIVIHNPFKSIKKLKTNKQGSLYFKKNQIEVLKKHISENDKELWFAIQFMFYCFLRPKEIRFLKIGDIDRWNEKIRVPGDISKNKKSDYVLITKPLCHMIDDSGILNYPNHYYIFGKNGEPGEKPVAVNHFRNKHLVYLQKFKFSSEYKLYSWKHTGICTAALSGLPLPFIQQQARHHSLDQVYAYLKRMGILDMENLKDKFPEL